MSSYAAPLLETFVTLLAVCAIAFLVLYGARKIGIGRARGPVELAGHLPLDARRAIYLVKVGASVLVVGVGEGGFTKLGEVPATDLPAGNDDGDTRPTPFGRVLARAFERKAPR